MAQGGESNASLEEGQAALFSHVAAAFEQFWAEVSRELSRHRVQPSCTWGWSSLRPLLHAVAAKGTLGQLAMELLSLLDRTTGRTG